MARKFKPTVAGGKVVEPKDVRVSERVVGALKLSDETAQVVEHGTVESVVRVGDKQWYVVGNTELQEVVKEQ